MGSKKKKKKKTFLERLDDILSKAAAYGPLVREDVPVARDLVARFRQSKSQDHLDLMEQGMELGVLLAKLEIRILGTTPEDL